MKNELSPAGCRVDVFLKRLKAHSPVMKLGYGIDEVSKRPPQPIQPPDNERISPSKVAESPCKPFALRFGARDPIGKDPAAAGFLKRVKLESKGLIMG